MIAAAGGLAGFAAAGHGRARAQAVGTTHRSSTMQITRAGSQPSGKGPAEYFTGTVHVDPLFPVREPGRVSAASVTFEPGARTASSIAGAAVRKRVDNDPRWEHDRYIIRDAPF
jgi:hypothetical protein